MAEESRRDQYETARETLADADDVSESDKQFIGEFLDAFDPDTFAEQPPDGESTKAHSTLRNYANILRQAGRRIDGELHEQDADGLNVYTQSLIHGTHPDVKDAGLAESSVRNHAGALRLLFDYHEDIDKSDIAMPEGERSSVDETDMFTSEEIEDLRDACPNPRDRAILELLIYTGQRVRAIQTLRLKDVFLDEGTFRLNPAVDGLKGAEGKRPLLGAVGPIRRWLKHHPASDDPESYLITCLPSANRGTSGAMLNDSQIGKRLNKIGREAGVDKPTNPHNFRHYFVTVCKRDYDLSDSEVKHLLGHRPDSDVMETTYAHLTDEEIAENVAVKADFKEPSQEESPLSPRTCPTCDEPLRTNARACSVCGTTFTPDAKAAQDQIQDMLYEGHAEDDGEHGDTIDDLRERIRNDPELKEAILAELLEE